MLVVMKTTCAVIFDISSQAEWHSAGAVCTDKTCHSLSTTCHFCVLNEGCVVLIDLQCITVKVNLRLQNVAVKKRQSKSGIFSQSSHS